MISIACGNIPAPGQGEGFLRTSICAKPWVTPSDTLQKFPENGNHFTGFVEVLFLLWSLRLIIAEM